MGVGLDNATKLFVERVHFDYSGLQLHITENGETIVITLLFREQGHRGIGATKQFKAELNLSFQCMFL